MIKETFRYIEYSKEKSFTKTKNGRIELKEFSDDLLFAVSFDYGFDAMYGDGAKTPSEVIGDVITADYDALGQGEGGHCKLKGSITYEEENFRPLESEGTIKFWLRPAFNNAVGEQWFSKPEPVMPIESGLYGVTIYKNDIPYNFNVNLTPSDTGLDIFNKLAVKLIGNGFQCFRVNNRIRVTSSGYGDEIEIKQPSDSNIKSLIELMGGVEKPFIANGPTENVDFLILKPKNDYKNAIILTHKKDSHIHLKMYNYLGDLVVDEDLGLWSNQYNKWYGFELNWNEQIGQLFINGKLNKVFMTNFERKDCRTFLTFSGSVPNYHLLDEFSVYNKQQHSKNYEVEKYPLTPYDKTSPYIDIFYGQGFKENEIKGIVIDSSDNVSFTVRIGLTWYYYLSGSWRNGDGSFMQSVDKPTMESKFEELFFNEKADLTIRVFFNSDGYTPSYIDEITILREVDGQGAAFVTSEIRIPIGTTVDLSSNSFIKITTDKGSKEVDLSTASSNQSAVTLEEIKQAIRDANVPGLASVTDDGNGRLVLIAETKGQESFISVSEAYNASALDIVWGNETSDIGEDNEFIKGGTYVDYSEIFRWIRSRLGAPLVPVELTDEQLEDCLSEAVQNYNRWRNFKENIIYVTLNGDPKNGWELPPEIGGEESILEIIVEPKFPSIYYVNRGDDLMTNVFVQQLFGRHSLNRNVADYHISLIANKDLNLIMGTEVRWEIINRRLFIYPQPDRTLRIGIKYKSALTLDEIVTSQQIRDLTLALAKITLGNIRSTFGNQIPGGDGMLTLNGSELKAEGQADKERILDEWKRSTNVYEFIIG